MTARLPALTLLVLLTAGTARAAEPRKVVLDVQGPNAVLLRKTLYRALSRAGVEVVFSPAGRLPPQPPARRIRQVIRVNHATALLMARVEGRRPRGVVVRIYGGGYWTAPIEVRWRASAVGALRRIPRTKRARLEYVLRELSGGVPTPSVPATPPPVAPPATPDTPPTPGAPGPETPGTPTPGTVAQIPSTEPSAADDTPDGPVVKLEAEPADTDDDDDDRDEPAGLDALEVTVGFRGFSRRLQVTDAPAQAFPRYFLRVGPAVVVAADWYPGAHFGRGPWGHVGVTASVESGFALRSALGTSIFPTDARAYQIGLKGRVPLGPVVIAGAVTYLSRSFSFLDSLGGLQAAPLPDVDYRGARFAMDLRWAFNERISMRLGAGYHLLRSAGELGSASYFQRLSGGAVDANLALVVGLVPGWSIRGGGDVIHYFLKTNAQASDGVSAGGAMDQSFGLSLALLFTFT